MSRSRALHRRAWSGRPDRPASSLDRRGPAAGHVPAASCRRRSRSPSHRSRPDPGAQLLADARASFTRVKDYMGTLVKEERVGGQLQPEQYIAIRVRQQPFSVYLKWTGPKQFEGQEAVYVAGKNENKMKAKGTGLAGIVGFVSLDPMDPRALKQSRHAITETGIGHLIETLTRGYEIGPPGPAGPGAGGLPGLHVPAEAVRRAWRRSTGSTTANSTATGRWCTSTRQTKLPVRFEAYDWPTAGGPPGGDKLECYSYIDLKFNVGLTDAAFGL